jgi:hypothetical protein
VAAATARIPTGIELLPGEYHQFNHGEWRRTFVLHPQRSPDLVLSESDDYLVSNDDSGKRTSGGQLLDLLEYFFAILVRQQVNISELVFDPTLTQEPLAGLAVTARAQGI